MLMFGQVECRSDNALNLRDLNNIDNQLDATMTVY